MILKELCDKIIKRQKRTKTENEKLEESKGSEGIVMGIGALKRDIREKIISYQYGKTQDDIWELLDTYDMYLESSYTSDELAEAAFLRGDAAFHMGRYHDTVKALTKSLGIEKSQEFSYLEADAYNMLGMLFSFVGYETVALDNYLSAIESAKKNRNLREQVAALLNTGLLYQSLFDYRKAMTYYKKGYEAASSNHASPQMLLMLLCLIQEAQLLCKMGRYDEAQRMKREIDSYYHVVAQDELLLSMCILEVLMEEHSGTEVRLQELIGKIRQFLDKDSGYLEQIDFYVDFCSFLVEKGRKNEAREFMDILEEKLGATEFFHLRMQLEELEVIYQKQYADEEHYLSACLHYMDLQREYEDTLKKFKRQNLANIESLQETEKIREEFEIRSKCDLATGLLNKATFQYEVETYLSERNRDVTDALVVIDIDNFKLVNDNFGHLVGDEVIDKLAELIRNRFGEGCICGRFGGDEFVIFIKNITDMAEAEEEIEELRETFAGIGFGKTKDVHNTVSIGVSYNYRINASYRTMFSSADEALMKAKEYGKNRVAFFEIKRGLLKYV